MNIHQDQDFILADREKRGKEKALSKEQEAQNKLLEQKERAA